MKVTFTILLALSLNACSPELKNEVSEKRIVVTGRVINYDPLNPVVYICPNRVAVKREDIKAILDEKGFFKSSFKSYIPIDFFLRHKANFLVLAHPGDSIYVEFDGSHDDRQSLLQDLKFKGDYAKENQKAAAFQYMYYSKKQYFDQRRAAMFKYRSDPNRFRIFVDSCYSEGQKLLNIFKNEYDPSKQVLNWASQQIDVDYYGDLFLYPLMYFQNSDNAYKAIPEGYFDFVKNIPRLDSLNLFSSYSIFSFVDKYAFYITATIREQNKDLFMSKDSALKYPERVDSIRFFGTINNTADPLLKQMALTEMLFEGLEFSSTSIIEKYQKEIKTIITKPYLIEPLFTEFNNTKDRLNNPKIASEILYSKLKSTSIAHSFDSLIILNRGKIIYVDCWATWCGPCIAEMTFSEELISKLKNKDITFLFVCIDSEEKNWKSVLSKYSLTGQHILLDRAKSSEFKEVFNIKGIPHYILFDKEGNLIQNNTQPPSAIREKLEALLK